MRVGTLALLTRKMPELAALGGGVSQGGTPTPLPGPSRPMSWFPKVSGLVGRLVALEENRNVSNNQRQRSIDSFPNTL